jgi:hypothetical protein
MENGTGEQGWSNSRSRHFVVNIYCVNGVCTCVCNLSCGQGKIRHGINSNSSASTTKKKSRQRYCIVSAAGWAKIWCRDTFWHCQPFFFPNGRERGEEVLWRMGRKVKWPSVFFPPSDESAGAIINVAIFHAGIFLRYPPHRESLSIR